MDDGDAGNNNLPIPQKIIEANIQVLNLEY